MHQPIQRQPVPTLKDLLQPDYSCVQHRSLSRYVHLLPLAQRESLAHIQAYYYISASFGLSLFAIASVFYRFTGSIMNPSVGLALCLIGAIKPVRFIREFPVSKL